MGYDDGSEHDRLGALVGRWKTEGWTREAPTVAATRIEAVDTYEWLPGGRALLHRVDAHVGDQKVDGSEIIGYDPARRAYIAQYFGSDGPGAYEASLRNEYGALVWRMQSETERFTGMFSDDGNTIAGHWELLDDDSGWHPWMDITLSKET
jgi:hypothetical protein